MGGIFFNFFKNRAFFAHIVTFVSPKNVKMIETTFLTHKYNCSFSRPAPKCVKMKRGDIILEDQPHNYEDDSDDDSVQVKYLPDNVTKYRFVGLNLLFVKDGVQRDGLG